MNAALVMAALTLTPPLRAGAWTRPESPRVVTPADIFEYMDGAGELYLAYRLARLEVYEYTAEQEEPILLELYRLESSDDGYGLLSGDWGGERVALDTTWPQTPPRALYGAGLLRIWSDDLFARVMAGAESPASRAAVLEIGRAVVAGRPSPQPPEVVRELPRTLAGLRLRSDRVTFLRSHLVLNSVYFLGTANLLRLSPTAEAVAASYTGDGAQTGGARIVVVRYPSEVAAREALAQFERDYLQRPTGGSGLEGGEEGGGTAGHAVRVEDGWVAHRLQGRRLVLVFEAPDAATAKAVVEELQP